MNSSSIHLAFSVNDDYVDHLCVALTSVLANHSCIPFSIYLIGNNLQEESRYKVERLTKWFRSCVLHFISVDTRCCTNFPLHISHTSVETYFRCFLPELLPDLDKILYLDADLIVDGDIRELWNTDISTYYMAGVEDLQVWREGHKKKLGFSDDEAYLNAGVLLFNLELIRRDGKSKEILDFAGTGKDLHYQDQDVLNLVFRGKIRSVDSRWNFATSNARREKDKRSNARIIHFTGARKPWLPKCRNYFRKRWFKYSRMTRSLQKRKLKVGLIIDEFFGGANTAFGGYGFLARKFITRYLPDKDIQIDVLLGRGKRYLSAMRYSVDGIRLYRLPKLHCLARRCLNKWNYDVYFSIELTTNYVLQHEMDSSKRLVLWIQDPRPEQVWKQVIDTMQAIKDPCFYDQAIYDSVHQLACEDRVTFISQGECLNDLARELYGLSRDTPIQNVPNPVLDWNVGEFKLEGKKKQVVFLGRLEAQKRAWLFCEVARLLPEYEFFVLGQFHRYRSDNQRMLRDYMGNGPSNLHFLGHMDGEEKKMYLKESRILLNTSIWEGIPISWLEALSFGTLLVSCLERDGLVERFGEYVGEIPGDGFAYVEKFVPAIRKIMEEDDLYEEKAMAAMRYIHTRHEKEPVISSLRKLLMENAVVRLK